MQFVYPWVLWFSLLIAIPILIHLFYFRRFKTVYFSQNKLLESVIKESRSQQKLRNLLILLLRILFILSLVLAFAQPYIKNESTISNLQNTYAIYIDNTFSMHDEGEQGISLLDEAKSKALAFVQAMPKNTSYLLFYHGQQHSYEKIFSSEEIQKKINEIFIAPSTERWSEILKRYKSAINARLTNQRIPLVWFSDGQKYAVDYTQWESDSLPVVLFHLNHPKKNNVSIDSIWFESPQHLINQREKLWITVTNHGSDDITALPVKLFVNDTLKSTSTINLQAQSSMNIFFDFVNIRAGWQYGKVEIADFPIVFDNTFYLTYKVYKTLSVAIVSDQIPPFFNALVKSDSLFTANYYSWNDVSSKTLYDKQAIILYNVTNISSGLWSELLLLAQKGKVIIFIPSTSMKPEEINKLFSATGVMFAEKDTTKLSLSLHSMEQSFFKGMFTRKEERLNMPWVTTKYPIRIQNNRIADILLQFENGENALIKVSHEKGNVFCFAFPILQQTTNFQLHPLFVAVFHRIIEKSIETTALYYILQNSLSFSVPIDSIFSDKPIELKNVYTQATHVPLQQFRYNEVVISPMVQNTEAGIYMLRHNGWNASHLAFNYPRQESEMKFYSNDEITQFFKDKGSITKSYETSDIEALKYTITKDKQGTFLWKWLLILAICFLLAEMAVIRFWKVV
ncbi:MAG: BatA domain-containing protein [Bacteroidales bacterium]|nr:BatA domain-containing protein [Bacteroidales bacterium]